MKSCHFTHVELSRDGVWTSGHLWKHGRPVDTSGFTSMLRYIENACNSGLLMRYCRIFAKPARELRKLSHTHLAENIVQFLNRDYAKCFAEEYQQDMAEELAIAIDQGRLLCLAGLQRRNGKHSPYRAVFFWKNSDSGGIALFGSEEGGFVRPRKQMSSAYAFTA